MNGNSIILFVLLVLSLMVNQHLYCNKPQISKSDTTYIYDTVTYTTVKDSLIPVIKIRKIPQLLTLHDTIEVIQEFFTQNVYIDTLRDSNIVLSVLDTIFKNKIVSRKYTYNLLRPQTVIVNTYKCKKVNVGIQGGFGVTPKGLQPYIGLGFNYSLRKP